MTYRLSHFINAMSKKKERTKLRPFVWPSPSLVLNVWASGSGESVNFMKKYFFKREFVENVSSGPIDLILYDVDTYTTGKKASKNFTWKEPKNHISEIEETSEIRQGILVWEWDQFLFKVSRTYWMLIKLTRLKIPCLPTDCSCGRMKRVWGKTRKK